MSQDLPKSLRQEQKQQVGDVSVDGQGNYVDFSQKQYITISVDEIKTKPFIKASPYKGLKKFDSSEWDAKRFWGREQLIEDIRKELDANNTLLLLGASGSGKSSVVSAGLIPKLAEEWGAKLVTLTLTPDENPFESLYASLITASFKQADAKIARQAESTTLTRIVNQKNKESFWLIFLDQFEELFTLSTEQERNQFIAGLVYLNNALERAKWRSVKVVMTMRADFSDRLSPYAEFSNITKGRIRFIADMQEHELRRAIEQPAAHHGVVFEAGLVEEIIKDVQGQAGSLPLLQYTLDQLWHREKISDQMRSLRKQTYWLLGGVPGALQNRVDEIYRQLCQAGKERAVKQIFLRLVSIDDSRVARRRAYRAEFEADPIKNAIIDDLIKEALLVSNLDRAGQRTVEIAHEALFSSWSTLRNWIAEDGQAIALKNRLADAVGRWLKASADEADSELWRGSTLDEVVKLRQEGAFDRLDIALNSDENRFVDSSVEWGERLEQEKEEQRQKELQQERQAREAAQKIAEQETKARRNAQKTTAGALVAGLALAAIAVFSAIQYRQSQINQVHTLRLSAEASLAAGQDLDALLTALRAGRQFKQLLFPPDELQAQVTETLRTVFYSANERDRWMWNGERAKEVFLKPDGQPLLITSEAGNFGSQFFLSDLQNNSSPIQLSIGHKVFFNPQGNQIAILRQDSPNSNQVFLHDLNGQSLLSPIISNNATFSSNGELLLIRSDNAGNVQISNQQNQLIEHQFNGIGQQQILGYDFNSHQLVTSTNDSNPENYSENYVIQVLSRDGNRELLQSQDFNSNPIRRSLRPDGVKFSSDGKMLLILEANAGGYLDFEIWKYINSCGQTTTGCWSSELDDNSFNSIFRGFLGSVDIANYGSNETIVATSVEGTVSLFNESGLLLDQLGGAIGNIQDISFSSDGKLLATAADDKNVRLWDLQGSQPRRINELDEQVQDISFSSNGQFVSFQQNGTIKLWSLNGELLLEFQSQITQIKDIDLSNDGKYLAIVDENGSSHLWAVQNDKLSEISLSIQEINAIAFSPDGQNFATAGKDGFIRVWNLQGAKQQEFDTKLVTPESNQEIKDIAFTPDGQSILVNDSYDSDSTLWSLNNQSQGETLGSSVVFKPTGEVLYVVEQEYGGGSTFLLKNLQGVSLAEFQGTPSAGVLASDFQLNPTGTLFAAAERDRVLIWNISGQLLTTFQIHSGSSEDQVDPIEKLMFSPDGQQIITITESGLMTLWSLGNLDELIARSCDWVRDYIAHSSEPEDRTLCDGIESVDSPTAVSIPSPSSSSTNPQSLGSTPVSETVQISPTPSSAPATTQQTSVQTSPTSITQEEALNLIKEWLQQKQQVFTPPYNLEILARYTNGEYYRSKRIEAEKYSLEGTQVHFSGIIVEPTSTVLVEANQAVIGVSITEACTYIQGETTEDCSSQNQSYSYTLQFDGMQWKIIASVKEG